MNEKTIKIFLADDTLIAREGLKIILETADDIEVVGETASAIGISARIQTACPDVLLMDLRWYGDDIAGWAAIKEVKAASPQVKIIAITAYDNLIREARMAGADAAILKTFTREELLAAIRGIAIQPTAPQILENPYVESLTQRELGILKLVAMGNRDKEIAKLLDIAPATVKNHVKSILAKLVAKNRTHAVDIARGQGLID